MCLLHSIFSLSIRPNFLNKSMYVLVHTTHILPWSCNISYNSLFQTKKVNSINENWFESSLNYFKLEFLRKKYIKNLSMAPCLLGKLSTKFIIYQEYNIEYSLDITLFNSKLVQCVGIMKDMQCSMLALKNCVAPLTSSTYTK